MIDYKNELNEKQYEAVTAKENRLLFLAGAGVGKTRTMIYRTAWLIDHDINPDNILLLTFTNKAAGEMVKRLKEMGKEEVLACTFHSFCVRELRTFGSHIDLDPNFNIISTPDEVQIVDMFIDRKKDPPSKIVVAATSMAINKDITIEKALKGNRKWSGYLDQPQRIEELSREARKYRYKNGQLSYDDLMVLFADLLQKNPDVARAIRQRYTHIMVDEYQDTNIVQDRTLDLIDPVNLAVVGDDCQSLYGFRGAEVKNIIDYPKKCNCRTIKIEQNYRSNQEILDVSNIMMKTYCSEGIPKWLTANHTKGGKPVLYRVNDSEDEANKVYAFIRSWIEAGNAPSEFCVLGRTSKALAALESILVRENISYEKRGGPKFFEQEHIQNVLAMMNIYRNPHNEIAWFRVLRILRNIGPANAVMIAHECYEKGLDLSILEKYEKRVYGKDLKKLFLELRKKRNSWHTKFHELCNYFIQTMEENVIKSRAREKELILFMIQETIKPDIDMLCQIADSYSSLVEFTDNLTMDAIPSMDEEKNKVILSTIHSAKGLEFEAVCIVGVGEYLFPGNQSDEELRCMYVALTRPKKYLLITSPRSARMGSEWKKVGLPYCLKACVKKIELVEC